MKGLFVATIAGLVPAVHAFTPSAGYTLELKASSPLLHFEPATHWEPVTFSESDESAWRPGMIGAGVASRLQNRTGASVSLEYGGTSATFVGGVVKEPAEGAFMFQLDGGAQPNPLVNLSLGSSEGFGRSVVAKTADSVAAGAHTVRLGLPSDAYFGLVRAELRPSVSVEMNVPDQGLACGRTNFSSALTSQAQPGVNLHGPWKASSAMGGVGGQPQVPYDSIVATEPAYLSFEPPNGTNSFYLHGVVGDGYGQYNVSISPAPPYPLSTTRFDANARWTVVDETLYYAPLDPKVQYLIEINGLDSSRLAFSGYTSCTSAPTSGEQSESNGTTKRNQSTATSKPNGQAAGDSASGSGGRIWGAVLGGVLGGIALLLLGLYFGRRHRRAKTKEFELRRNQFVIDDNGPPPTPFVRLDTAETSQHPSVANDHSVKPVQPLSPNEASGTEPSTAEVLEAAFAKHNAATTPLSEPLEPEEDAGRLPLTDGRRGERPPPTYNPRWLEEEVSSTSGSSLAGSDSERGRRRPLPLSPGTVEAPHIPGPEKP